MWWLFQKVSEAAGVAIYNYSRESNDCDGRIVFDKHRKEVTEFQHCSTDRSNFDKNVAIDKFACYIVDEGFPNKRKVACA